MEYHLRGDWNFLSEDRKTITSTCLCGGCFEDVIEVKEGDIVSVNALTIRPIGWVGHGRLDRKIVI